MPVPLDNLERAVQAACSPNQDTEMWTGVLRPFMEQYRIDTKKRIACFIGQVGIESASFTHLEENLNYSAARLCQVWPTRFPSNPDLLAQRCSGSPEMLANIVYCDRMGNGDEASGDGWHYRGAGLIQLTGKANQTAFAVDAHMLPGLIGDYLRTPKGGAHSACWFWNSKGLNRYADLWQLTMISHIINGGDCGVRDRINLTNYIGKVLGV